VSLDLYTARVSYGGPDRLDVARQTSDATGVVFAPSWALLRPAKAAQRAGTFDAAAWAAYERAYVNEMRFSYARNAGTWLGLLRRHGSVTLCCFCVLAPGKPWCHRLPLAAVLVKTAAAHGFEVRYRGERGDATERENDHE